MTIKSVLLPFTNIPLSARILIAMFIGLAIGSYTSTVYTGVDATAKAFVMLLQMTALPYIALSLITGIGGLSPLKAAQTFKVSFVILLTLLVTVLSFIFLAPIAFPDWVNADFYSASTVKVSSEFDLVNLFIPANPFNAFANALIPAIVMFSIFVGIGLMTVKNKKHTLLVLSNLQKAIANVSALVMSFAPLGVFCIALRAAATIDSSQIDGLLVYIVTAAVLVILLSFIVLPAMVAIITPFGYRQIIKASREAMITAFATGSFFIVIPTIVEKTKDLIKELSNENSSQSTDASKVPSIIVPITFSLPVGGKLLALLFTLFAAWFSGAHISLNDYTNLIVAGIPQLFGTSTLAVPNLLDLFNVSASMFDFFIVAENLIVGRISAILSVIFAICLPLLIATSMLKAFTFKWKVFLKYAILMPIISIVAFISLRFTFSEISHQYQGYNKFIERDLLFKGVKTKVIDQAKNNTSTQQPFIDVLTRINNRGFLRVGYFRDDLPYSFHNNKGDLVGFDIEIMNQLAADLNVDIEFVKIFRNEASTLLSSGYLDITTGIPVIPDNMREFTLTVPYSKQDIAFIVKDIRRAEFTHWEGILKRDDLIIGIPEIFFYKDAINRFFTHGKAWEITTPRLFFKEEFQHIDGMLFGAATASAWTLLYPNYTVVVPKPIRAPISMAFPINKNDSAFELFMRNWISMKQQSTMLDQLFDYWIAGKTPKDNFMSIKK
ncbi:MAG: cation:dicarboxylase symporter family transporter [Colwellia sp.]|nr:cation:dicarboxylase symporter family transporter [Colwellia sp.]